MGRVEPENQKKYICVGVLAHVDAGKTTLAESILYTQGTIRSQGRVDHGDAFLDTYELEKERGITIFSKQALFSLGEKEVTLLDTPGHVDFSAEMERTLQVLDYAILVISAGDGIQGHVLTLWKLLQRYRVPTFLFINKMDLNGVNREERLTELQNRLSEHCLDFGQPLEELYEDMAICEECTLEQYLEHAEVSGEEIRRLIRERKLFPCFFGSALKNQGVTEFLDGLAKYMECPRYPQEFGAKIFKISRDVQGNRLTHMKITGGTLKVKAPVQIKDRESEKTDQLRIYSGSGFQAVQEVKAGQICAVTGLAHTKAGEGLGVEKASALPVLEPVLSYRIELPEGCDIHGMLGKLRQLEEEDPMLQIVWHEDSQEIHAKVMGDVQIEVLRRLILERFQTKVEFGQGSISYKETITKPVEGVGHFEPLRHYAEVHLLMEPGERGSGLIFEADCSEDILERNWQRLILTNLQEKQHRGVLTGSPITDIKITVINGRAHLKHTEGGDFRQATYRAVRHGLKCTESVLLEPVYEFRLEVPQENIGRAMTDITRMQGSFDGPETEGELAVLTGRAPVATMRDYQREVADYTRGMGRLFCTLGGYEPCHNEQEVVENIGYDSELDAENPTGSVFCAHGAGFPVPWNQVRNYMHIEGLQLSEKEEVSEPEDIRETKPFKSSVFVGSAMDDELEEIFNRTYGAGKEERRGWKKSRMESVKHMSGAVSYKPKEKLDEYLLVDGYNIIFAWEDLRELAKINIASARDRLQDILSNYQGYKKNTLILVFDAYKVAGGTGSVQKYHNIYVVYTKEAETADQYIEKTAHAISKKYHVTVATSDALEQVIIFGAGAARLSALGLREEVEAVSAEIRERFLEKEKKSGQKLSDAMSDEVLGALESEKKKEKGEHR